MTGNGEDKKRNNSGKAEERVKKNFDPNRRNERRNGKDSYRGGNRSRAMGSMEFGSFHKKTSFRNADIRLEETAEDIRVDILRIEKEIRLMIDEIKSMKL